jgi:hypothetical protein
MEERVEKYNALMLATIKGHLAIEQAMNEFLEASLSDATHIRGARFGFSDKIRLCRAMALDQSEDQLWAVVGCVNGLRNAVAHGHPEDKVTQAMRTVRSEFFASLTPEQATGLKGEPDDRIVGSACFTCAGFIVVLGEEARDRQRATRGGGTLA